jgi:hypothetical protein
MRERYRCFAGTSRALDAILVLAAMLLSVRGETANPKYNRVARFGTPTVDGKLDDSVW